jgi:anaerobic nitric oxide reductase transcription regulator
LQREDGARFIHEIRFAMETRVTLLDAAWGLARASSASDALHLILDGIGGLVRPDAVAVLTLEPDGTLAVGAHRGLSATALQRRFRPDQHQRLQQALASEAPIRFHDSAESDPYDGLLATSSAPLSPIHACVVAPLRIGVDRVGLLTMDALDPRGLDEISERDIALFAALTSAALRQARFRSELETLRLRAVSAARPDTAAEPKRAGVIVGNSPPMQALDREIQLLAALPLTVLIQGATGVGKELVARALHARSARATRPLVVVNCAALPEPLLESELFGHARGAFTGATHARVGKFAAADGGTLLLDEVGELSPGAQAALLRVLQEGEVQRVGDDRERRVDVRILAATNRDLRREVEAGRFRADLYHRIAVYPLTVPALRERTEDLPALVEHFGRAFAEQLGGQLAPLRPELLERLARYPWPGNVRELKHTVERALLRFVVQHATSGIPSGLPLELRWDENDFATQTRDLPRHVPMVPSREAETLQEALERTRRQALERALAEADGNVALAARRLGLSRSFAYKESVRLGLIQRRPPSRR